jgi:hypothetical protein
MGLIFKNLSVKNYTAKTTPVSINPTFASAPFRTSYQATPKNLALWYASPSDSQYIAAAAATAGNIVSFVQSTVEYRGVVATVATSTNTIYGPTAYVVTFTFSGAAPTYTLPAVDGTPDITPVNLI